MDPLVEGVGALVEEGVGLVEEGVGLAVGEVGAHPATEGVEGVQVGVWHQWVGPPQEEREPLPLAAAAIRWDIQSAPAPPPTLHNSKYHVTFGPSPPIHHSFLSLQPTQLL